MVTLGSPWCFRLSWTSSINFLLDCQDMEEKNGYKGKLRTLLPVNLVFSSCEVIQAGLGKRRNPIPSSLAPAYIVLQVCDYVSPHFQRPLIWEELRDFFQLSSSSETVGCLRKGNFPTAVFWHLLPPPTSPVAEWQKPLLADIWDAVEWS